MKLIVELLVIGASSIIVQLSNVALADDYTLLPIREISAIQHQPWFASIQRNHADYCTGSIISESIILSAASCFGIDVPSNLIVRVGSSGGSEYNVTEARIHESFNNTGSSDLVLLKVSPPFVFNENVRPIGLPSKEYVVDPGTVADVVGSGLGDELWDAKLRTVKCGPEILDGHICAGPLTSNKKFCLGDAGNPLVADGILIGVMRQGPSCIEPESPRVFTDVSYHLDWIVQNASALEPFSYETGEVSTIQHQPWIASIHWENGLWCTGSIVSESVILSAAFCFARYAMSNLTARVGSSVVDSGGSVHQVIIVSNHEDFSYDYVSGSVNDVALLKVSPPFKFNRNVSPIPLAGRGYVVEPNVSTGGWSRTDIERDLELRDTKYRIVKCGREVSDGQVCVGPSILKRITCTSDDGDPLVQNDVLVGVAAQKISCASPLYPRAYTSVSYYHDWINKTIDELESTPVEIGDNSTIQMQPWLASVQLNNEHVCTGSIISDNIILTSASCATRIHLPSNWTVRVGSSLVRIGGSSHQVIDTRIHGCYVPSKGSVNDVALLKVSPPFQLDGLQVNKIELAREGKIDRSDYTLASIGGWKWSDNQGAAVLKEAKVQIIDHCAGIVSEGQICVTPVNKQGCLSLIDIGGPLVTNRTQIGLMSWDLPRSSPQCQRVYNNVSHYHEWIEMNSKELTSALNPQAKEFKILTELLTNLFSSKFCIGDFCN